MAKEMRCVLFGAAPVNDYAAIGRLLKETDILVGVDGGLKHIEALNKIPDLLIGDFDSIGSPFPACEAISYPAVKDETDLFLAAREAVKRGFTSFLLLGAMGGRLDHTLANLSLLNELTEQGCSAVMADEQNAVMVLIPGTYPLEQGGYTKCSILPFGEICEGVTIKGVKYPLEHKTLKNTFPLGVSNEIIEKGAFLRFTAGRIILIHTKD